METMQQQGFSRFISLTNNVKLEGLYRTLGFKPCTLPEYQARQALSPDVQMYYKKI